MNTTCSWTQHKSVRRYTAYVYYSKIITVMFAVPTDNLQVFLFPHSFGRHDETNVD